MAKKYLMFSLNDDRVGNLGEILGNKTSRKILDLLSEKDLSESDISRILDIPFSTVSYNIGKLLKVGLIKEKMHLFSVKGKRVPLYTVSNRDILISPGESSRDKLKGSVSLISVSAIFTAFIIWLERFRKIPREEVFMGAAEAAPMLLEKSAEVTSSSGFPFGVVGWFLFVMWFLVLAFVIFSHLKLNKKDVRR